MPAEVFISEPLGEVLVIDFLLEKKIIKVATSPDVKANMGETMWLSFDLSKVHLFDAQSGATIN
jgi:multiple sugar transport system ATP-binding protein